MITTIVVVFAEFAIQTTFLTAALWIMIKIQKLNYNFLGLLGSAGLTTLVEMVLDHFLGVYMSSPIVVAVLCLCIAKLTRSEHVDVIFTVAVGYALMFGMNLWLMGALLGDLRPSARNAETVDAVEELRVEARSISNAPTALRPVTPPASSNLPAVRTSAATADSTKLDQGTSPTPAAEIARDFTVKGISRNSRESSIMIHTGIKTYTLLLGESRSVKTRQGEVTLKFTELGKDFVVMDINGQPARISLY